MNPRTEALAVIAKKKKKKKPAGDRKQYPDGRPPKVKYDPYLDDASVPLQQRTYRQIQRDREHETRTRFGPTERIQAAQGRNIPAWYAEYDRIAKEAAANTDKSFKSAGTAIDASAQAGNKAAEGERAKMQVADAASAALRGTTASSEADKTAVQAQESNNSLRTAALSALASRGGASTARAYEAQRIGAGESVDQQQRNAYRQRQTARDKGDFRVTYDAKAQDNERAYSLATGGLAQKGAIEAAKLAQDSRESARKRKHDRNMSDRDAGHSLTLAERKAALVKGKPGEEKYGNQGLTPKDRATRIDAIRSAAETLRAIYKNGQLTYNATLPDGTTGSKTTAIGINGQSKKLVAGLIGKQNGLSDEWAQWAVTFLVVNGKLPATSMSARKLRHRYGIVPDHLK